MSWHAKMGAFKSKLVIRQEIGPFWQSQKDPKIKIMRKCSTKAWERMDAMPWWIRDWDGTKLGTIPNELDHTEIMPKTQWWGGVAQFIEAWERMEAMPWWIRDWDKHKVGVDPKWVGPSRNYPQIPMMRRCRTIYRGLRKNGGDALMDQPVNLSPPVTRSACLTNNPILRCSSLQLQSC